MPAINAPAAYEHARRARYAEHPAAERVAEPIPEPEAVGSAPLADTAPEQRVIGRYEALSNPMHRYQEPEAPPPALPDPLAPSPVPLDEAPVRFDPEHDTISRTIADRVSAVLRENRALREVHGLPDLRPTIIREAYAEGGVEGLKAMARDAEAQSRRLQQRAQAERPLTPEQEQAYAGIVGQIPGPVEMGPPSPAVQVQRAANGARSLEGLVANLPQDAVKAQVPFRALEPSEVAGDAELRNEYYRP